MDFPGQASRQQQGTAGQTTEHGAGPSHSVGIHIPSFTEIQSAQQPSRGALNSFFKPKGLLSAARQQEQQQQPQQPPGHQQQVGPLSSWAAPPNPMPGISSAGAQQQQYHHPQQQQPATLWPAGSAAHAAAQTPYAQQQIRSTDQPLQGMTTAPANNGTALYDAKGFAQQGAPALPVASGNAIAVSKRQTGNPVLKHIRNVRWVFGDIGPDYLLGANACALFLSLRYHLLHPNYILYRIKELGRAYGLRIVLVQVDVDDVVKPLADITKAAALNDCTLICAWSAEEAGRYLETYKAFENKPATGIQERVDADYASRLASALTAVRAVNRTDALALGAQLGTLSDVITADKAALSAVPGVGPIKVQNLWDTFNKPFRKQGNAADAGVVAAVPPAPAPASALQTSLMGSHEQQGAADHQEGKASSGYASRDNASSMKSQDQPPSLHRFEHATTSITTAGQRDVDMGQAGTSQEGERGGVSDVVDVREDEGQDEVEEEDRDDLVHQASQMIFKMQAGAMAVGALQSEDEHSGAEDDVRDWAEEEEEI